MTQRPATVNLVAPITNLHLVAVTLEKLLARVNGLPGIGVMFGPPGTGKTVACNTVATEMRGYYVQVRSAWNRKTLLAKILAEMSIEPEKTIPAMLDQVADQLRGSRRPLIIDEFNKCVRNGSMIELVRDIYEASHGTLLLVGDQRIPAKLRSWEAFDSRVMARIEAAPVSLDDARKLVPIYCHGGVTIADDLLEHVVAKAAGSVRRVCVNLARIHEEAMMLAESEMTLALWGDRELYQPAATGSKRQKAEGDAHVA